MITDAWYAVCFSDELSNEPRKVNLQHGDYVVFRDPLGWVRAHAAYCPHRGCDLSLGRVKGEALICAFHGWHFDRKGTCTHIPANASQTYIPSGRRLRTFRTREQNGLVWVYSGAESSCTSQRAGSKESPSQEIFFETFPEMSADEWVRTPFKKTWKAHFTRIVESVLDVSHLPFVHADTTGRGVSPVVQHLEYHVTPKGLLVYPTPFAPSHPMEPPVERSSEQRTIIELLFPNQWIIRTPVEEGKWMCTFLTFTPIDEETTDIYGFVMRNFDQDLDFLTSFHMEHTDFVMGQDQVILESLRPRAAPFNMRREAHVASDVPTLHYRRRLREALGGKSSGSDAPAGP